MSRFFLLLDPPSNQLYQQLIAAHEGCPSAPKNLQLTASASVKSDAAHPSVTTNHLYTCWPVNFELINALLPDQDKALQGVLEPIAHELTNLGATQVLIPNITLSLVFSRLGLLANQLIDPVNLLRQYLSHHKGASRQQFTIYGGIHTARSQLWTRAVDLNTWTFNPSPDNHAQRVDQIRRCTFTKASSDQRWLKSAALKLANIMSQNSSELSVLACSELSQIYHQHKSCFDGLQIIDLAELQVASFNGLN